MDPRNSTITITYGDRAENHAGMQQIGEAKSVGFTVAELVGIRDHFHKYNVKCELIDLNAATKEKTDEAAILIIRRGVDVLMGAGAADSFFKEQANLNHDKKFLHYGKVANKKARYNLCFSNESQEPDYAAGKGRIIPFRDVVFLSTLRDRLSQFFGPKAAGMVAEGNYYYDVNTCYINFHGDSERSMVIAVRLGCDMPLYYQWFHNSKPIGDIIKLILSHGDIYIMSQKAVGTDWKTRRFPTLRHAAGLEKNVEFK